MVLETIIGLAVLAIVGIIVKLVTMYDTIAVLFGMFFVGSIIVFIAWVLGSVVMEIMGK